MLIDILIRITTVYNVRKTTKKKKKSNKNQRWVQYSYLNFFFISLFGKWLNGSIFFFFVQFESDRHIKSLLRFNDSLLIAESHNCKGNLFYSLAPLIEKYIPFFVILIIKKVVTSCKNSHRQCSFSFGSVCYHFVSTILIITM